MQILIILRGLPAQKKIYKSILNIQQIIYNNNNNNDNNTDMWYNKCSLLAYLVIINEYFDL